VTPVSTMPKNSSFVGTRQSAKPANASAFTAVIQVPVAVAQS
jgi:hypothetical protein